MWIEPDAELSKLEALLQSHSGLYRKTWGCVRIFKISNTNRTVLAIIDYTVFENSLFETVEHVLLLEHEV